MNLNDIKQINVTDVKLFGNAIIESTVENVYANDVLQAEYRAEKAVQAHAKANGQVVSWDRWELIKRGDGLAETWTVRFFSS